MMTKTTPENEEGDTHICAVNVAREWLGDRREIVGSEPCSHPASRHDASMCYACDEEGSTAGMLHEFSSIATDDTGRLAAHDPQAALRPKHGAPGQRGGLHIGSITSCESC
jgi:hypothetical protein